MRRIWAICSKELQMYFFSPVAYVAFAFYVLLSSFFFYVNFVAGQPPIVDARSIVGNTTFIYLFIIPLLTMRLVADEFRQGTDELLLTSPAGISEIVLGKYLSALIVQVGLVAISLVYPLIMSSFGTLDMPVTWLSYLSMFLLGCAMMAIGLFASSLSNNQMVAGITGFVILLLLWLLDWVSSSMTGKLKDYVGQFSLTGHLSNLQKGVFHGGDILFYITLTAVFLVLCIQVLERKRWR
ncbi:ABC transporter permease [Paenibacillus qinlingensis]|uniref:ABC-2 type transport system permease protein n=1 Tax=Paenibacillus qinlingensis TaxID=1837343 RepID=A0ABU1P1C8_9BACL|nr:ABC transporter permease [Paenibacillus qinlingensis]MDR6553523.1 ABC-2 type transport system permease protein [Paenibacillus qinlingensis]NQX61869.1 ABC transporter permease [Paenibacillus qinlingensis]